MASTTATSRPASSSTMLVEPAPEVTNPTGTFTVPDLSSDEEADAADALQPPDLALFFAEGEGYFIVDDQVKEDGPESYRSVRCAVDGTIHNRKEVKPHKRQYPDQEIRMWREYKFLPTIKESICYPKYVATYHQYCNGGKLNEYLGVQRHDGNLPWARGISENFVWKLFADLLRIVDHFHHPESGTTPTAIRSIYPHDILLHYPHETSIPDFYLSDLALAQDTRTPSFVRCDDGYTDLEMLRYCLHATMTLQDGLEASQGKYIHFVQRLSQFAAGFANDPNRQTYRAEVERDYTTGTISPTRMTFDDRHCQIFSLELCGYIDQLTKIIGDGPSEDPLPPDTLARQMEHERREIGRLLREVTAESNRRNNLPNPNPPIVPSYNPLLFSDIATARRYRPSRADACFIARVCPQSYKILEVESQPGIGQFISKAEFDDYWWNEKLRGRIPYTLVPEEVAHLNNLAVDKYWPKLSALPPQFQQRPLQHPADRPDYMLGPDPFPSTNDMYYGPSQPSAIRPDQLLGITRPAKRQRTTATTVGGDISSPAIDPPSTVVIETDSPFRLQVAPKDRALTNTVQGIFGDGIHEISAVEVGNVGTSAAELNAFNVARHSFWNGMTVKVLREIMARRGMAFERLIRRKAHLVDILVSDDHRRTTRGQAINFGVL